MGMFDEVYAKCPACEPGTMEIQSKAGECTLARYPINEVPAEIAVDIDGQYMTCRDCGHCVRVRIPGTQPRRMAMVIE